MKKTHFFTLIVAVVCGTVRGAAQIPVVDGDLAFARLAEFIAISPRVSGSENALRAADWIAGQSRRAGVPEVRTETWTEETAHGKKKFVNVIAVLPGAKPSRIIVGSHFDTKHLPDLPGFTGANDSGSSTALLLAMMKAIVEGGFTPPHTLEFVFFDGEEAVGKYGPKDGLHGSRRHARKIRESGRQDSYLAMILLDMVGDADLTVTLPADTPEKLGGTVLEAARELGVADKFSFLGTPVLDDHVPFAEIGMPAIDIIDFKYGPDNSYWHTAEDTLDKISAQSLETVGNVVLRAIWTGRF